MSTSREYEIVVFGASGYTGKLTAEYIAAKLQTNLRWAIAGRSQAKLESIAAELKASHPDRVQPAIEVCGLNDTEVGALAKKTALLISGVGPYCLHGEYAFKACAVNGTHYLDVTGEFPWVHDMIKKYEETAKSSGSIMISQIGIESALPDLAAWTMVEMNKIRFNAPTADVVLAIEEMSIHLSGGTSATPFAVIKTYRVKDILAAGAPYALSPIPGPKLPDNTSWFTKIFGVRSVPDLGTLTTAQSSVIDTPIVQRSWGLLGYGPKFRYGEYMKVRNAFQGVAIHIALLIAPLFLFVPFIENIAKLFIPASGDGATKAQGAKDRLEFRGVATPDVSTPNPPRASVHAAIEGSVYALTGALLSEAAATILYDDLKLPGGIYTPACLGQKFVDRLEPAGFTIRKKFLEY